MNEDVSKLPVIGRCSAPLKPLPAGAWDSHSHVFGPFEAYPLLAERRYDPPLSTGAQYLEMLDTVGFAHGVIVHPSAYGYDNAATAHGISLAPARLRGVCVVDPKTDERALQDLHAQGFRAMRFTMTGPRARQYAGSLDFDDLDRLAPAMRALGWHVQAWATCAEIVKAADRLSNCGMPVVFDHMGYFDVAAGTGDAIFRSYLDLLVSGDFWVKTTPIRLTKTDPSFESIRPFHDLLLAAIPDRALFGSDWPYLSLDAKRPDTGRLVDLFDAWTPDAALRTKVFVDNPKRLYGGG
jgi:predicted TIM-barrel fold metal-dependent hydrolase